MGLLLFGAAEDNGVAAQERGEDPGGDAEVDPGQRLADAIDVKRAGAHPAVLLGDEQKLDPQRVPAHLVNLFDRKLVVVIELQQLFVGEGSFGIFPDRCENQVEGVLVEADLLLDVHGCSPS